MELLKSLSTAEKKTIRKAVERELERYRIYKTTTFRREVRNTPSYEPRYHGPTNKTTDQTAKVAIYNVDEERKRTEFCEWMEFAINRLPEKERFLIQERYTNKESEYMTDVKMYSFIFDPPMSERTYMTIKNRAMLKIAMMLQLDCGVDLSV